MDVVKLPKKVRMVCYEIMDGKEGALDTLESFADKYPHQVAAVKAEVAYFNLDYEKALALDLTILPWLEEWYYSNVSDEHMIAMTVAAIQLHREQELIEALTKEQARIRAENGLPQRDRFCGIMIDCLTRGVMPFSEGNKNAPYCEPEEPQTREQLWEQIKSKNKKLTPDDPKGKAQLFYFGNKLQGKYGHLGFKYKKSDKTLTRHSKNFTYMIAFSSFGGNTKDSISIEVCYIINTRPYDPYGYAKPDINTQPLFYSLRDNEIYLDIGNEEKIDNTFEIVCQWMDKILIPKMNELCAAE